MNGTLMPLHFPAPTAPDFCKCDYFYSTPFEPEPADCDLAFLKLPTGSHPVTWIIEPEHEEHWGLPYIVTHGTCQFQFQASGENALALRSIDFAPDELRAMAGWMIAQCVSGIHNGGISTRRISNTLRYVAEGTTFHEDPFPTDTTFLTLTVWNSAQGDPLYNAGDMDPLSGLAVVEAIAAALNEEPEGPIKVNIERNYEYFYSAVLEMNRYNYRTWWDPPPEASNVSHANSTGRIRNSTLPANLSLSEPEALNLTNSCGTVLRETTMKCEGLGGGGGVSTS
ncbi:hypothetical protein N7G274_010771 [Stereocaulon virgatum]|uniref:Uncharacterized protein n=1 Tax=Stereocaulon virgatum TaxID=373712 RepID=A0ABR3ZTY0_9LECA